jgi:AcrR family transcriptional regulator
MDGGLRERNRRAALREINMAAMRLFLDHGFTQTTTEQIARAAGMSQRSLFRFVQTKEDLVLGDLLETGHKVLAAAPLCFRISLGCNAECATCHRRGFVL